MDNRDTGTKMRAQPTEKGDLSSAVRGGEFLSTTRPQIMARAVDRTLPHIFAILG